MIDEAREMAREEPQEAIEVVSELTLYDLPRPEAVPEPQAPLIADPLLVGEIDCPSESSPLTEHRLVEALEANEGHMRRAASLPPTAEPATWQDIAGMLAVRVNEQLLDAATPERTCTFSAEAIETVQFPEAERWRAIREHLEDLRDAPRPVGPWVETTARVIAETVLEDVENAKPVESEELFLMFNETDSAVAFAMESARREDTEFDIQESRQWRLTSSRRCESGAIKRASTSRSTRDYPTSRPSSSWPSEGHNPMTNDVILRSRA